MAGLTFDLLFSWFTGLIEKKEKEKDNRIAFYNI